MAAIAEIAGFTALQLWFHISELEALSTYYTVYVIKTVIIYSYTHARLHTVYT